MMRVRYVGADMPLLLTNGKIYECIGIEGGGSWLRIIDDEEEDYIYMINCPCDVFDQKNKHGKWQIVEDEDDKLHKAFRFCKEPIYEYNEETGEVKKVE